MDNTKKKVQLVISKREFVDENKKSTIYDKYQIVVDGVTIDIGINDKFKELAKYLFKTDDIQLNESVRIGD